MLVVAAHPDDEVIGASTILCEMSHVSVLHATDGAPLDLCDARAAGFGTRADYTGVRRAERGAALAMAGVSAERTLDLDIPDQQAGHRLAELACSLRGVIRRTGARLVLTHPYEGGHPDHDALAFAVAAAVRSIGRDGDAPPHVWEMACYHERDGVLATGVFPASEDQGHVVALDDEARARKQRMFDCYATQSRVLASFPVGEERFRRAPGYDFTAPPNRGVVYYERFAWGMTRAVWMERVRGAIAVLSLAAPE